jgi:hypothetical protein
MMILKDFFQVFKLKKRYDLHENLHLLINRYYVLPNTYHLFFEILIVVNSSIIDIGSKHRNLYQLQDVVELSV